MAKWTPAGEMRKYITIEQIAVATTASGETTNTPSTFCNAWAKIEPATGREYYLAKASIDTNTHRINMRYQAGITPRMRATYQGRIFNFTSVNDIGELHREIEIMATEIA